MRLRHYFLPLFLIACGPEDPSRTPEVRTASVTGPVELAGGLVFSTVIWKDRRWQIVEADPARCRLKLLLSADGNSPLRDFPRFIETQKAAGYRTVWMMNAGMFQDNGMPVGLCVADGKEVTPLNTAEGKGNFFLKPNGVFALTGSGAVIRETGEWQAAVPAEIRLATQSGPLLVRSGAIHPAIREDSTNRYLRNGAGVRADGRVVFAISTEQVTFYEMATLFRDALHCPDALYLDGAISAMYAPAAGVHADARSLGPVLGVWVRE